MKKHKISDLNRLYKDAEDEDRSHFSEMRSNILLVAGEHYSRRNVNQFYTRIRETQRLTDNQRLRLTKNHIAKLASHYEEAIMSQSPGVKIVPKNESEVQDQKEAELNESIWQHLKDKHGIREKKRMWCKDFVTLGEVAVKIFWDPMAGDFMGYAQKSDELGQDMYEDDGSPMADEDMPMFRGDIAYERIFGFNLMRAPGAKTMDESPYLIVRKMAEIDPLKKRYQDDEHKLKMIQPSEKMEYVIFDNSSGEYKRTKEQVLIREYYFRPSPVCPRGYFYITTEEGILESGELPYGIFPIVTTYFDLNPTVPRGKSIIKRARPFQGEINRSASQQATHQVTLGSDKIIYQSGTKLAPGALLPGVRGLTYQGAPPTVLPGRDGGQFSQYIKDNVDELYFACEADELLQSRESQADVDPWAKLFNSFRTRKKYAKYGERFEQFLVDVCKVSLKLCKIYLPDDELIAAIGKKEMVNIPEFKRTEPLNYEIKVVPQADDLETQMGKQLTMNHLLQYVGKQLDESNIGKIMRNMPFGNIEESFDDLTIDYDNIKNDILALERGEMVEPRPGDNHKYIIGRLNHRMKKSDFRYLQPQIQEMFQEKLSMHQQAESEELKQLKAAQSELVPTDGPMVACDLYVENKEDPSKAPKRARLPMRAVQWLVEMIERQGSTMDGLEQQEQYQQAEIAKKFLAQGRGGPQPPSPGAGMPEGGM